MFPSTEREHVTDRADRSIDLSREVPDYQEVGERDLWQTAGLRERAGHYTQWPGN